MSGMVLFAAIAVLAALLEDHLVFRGLFHKQLEESIKPFDFQHYVVGWLPLWWGVLAFSFSAIGAAITCTFWAIIAEVNGLPTATPVLMGLTALVVAVGGIIVPIATAYMKLKSDTMQLDFFKDKAVELQQQLDKLHVSHTENRADIKKIADVTKNVIEATTKDPSDAVKMADIDRGDKEKEVKDGTTTEGN
jgi:hypothetical protein